MSPAADAYNALPHIDDLVERGVRSVQSDLPPVTGAMWTLAHKHFNLASGELLRFDASDDRITTRVIDAADAGALFPCQYVRTGDGWTVTGVSPNKVDMALPSTDGSGMLTAIFHDGGQWMERTNEADRTQVHYRWDRAVETGIDTVVTAVWGNHSNNCMKCRNLTVGELRHHG